LVEQLKRWCAHQAGGLRLSHDCVPRFLARPTAIALATDHGLAARVAEPALSATRKRFRTRLRRAVGRAHL